MDEKKGAEVEEPVTEKVEDAKVTEAKVTSENPQPQPEPQLLPPGEEATVGEEIKNEAKRESQPQAESQPTEVVDKRFEEVISGEESSEKERIKEEKINGKEENPEEKKREDISTSSLLREERQKLETSEQNEGKDEANEEMAKLNPKEEELKEELIDTLLQKRHKMYSSSWFYDSSSDVYPTIEEQVELCRKIASQLIDEDKESKGSTMFYKRVKRAHKWVHESKSGAASDLESDTESTNNGKVKPLSSGPPKLKLLFDPREMKTLERLKGRGFSEHNVVSPDVCRDLVQELQSPEINKGAVLFLKRKQQSVDWVVPEFPASVPVNQAGGKPRPENQPKPVQTQAPTPQPTLQPLQSTMQPIQQQYVTPQFADPAPLPPQQLKQVQSFQPTKYSFNEALYMPRAPTGWGQKPSQALPRSLPPQSSLPVYQPPQQPVQQPMQYQPQPQPQPLQQPVQQPLQYLPQQPVQQPMQQPMQQQEQQYQPPPVQPQQPFTQQQVPQQQPQPVQQQYQPQPPPQQQPQPPQQTHAASTQQYQPLQHLYVYERAPAFYQQKQDQQQHLLFQQQQQALYQQQSAFFQNQHKPRLGVQRQVEQQVRKQQPVQSNSQEQQQQLQQQSQKMQQQQQPRAPAPRPAAPPAASPARPGLANAAAAVTLPPLDPPKKHCLADYYVPPVMPSLPPISSLSNCCPKSWSAFKCKMPA